MVKKRSEIVESTRKSSMKSEDFFSQQKRMELNNFLASHETVDGRNPTAVGYELTLPSYPNGAGFLPSRGSSTL